MNHTGFQRTRDASLHPSKLYMIHSLPRTPQMGSAILPAELAWMEFPSQSVIRSPHNHLDDLFSCFAALTPPHSPLPDDCRSDRLG